MSSPTFESYLSKLFGSGLREAAKIIRQKRELRSARAGETGDAQEELKIRQEYVTLYMRVAMTATAFVVGVFLLIFSSAQGGMAETGGGLIGTSVGYWLR